MDWSDAQARFDSPMFDGIRAPLEVLRESVDWPSHLQINALAEGLVNAAGSPLRFVAADESDSAMAYESRIAASGEVPTRERNWHDLFNALTWLSFPTAKGAISRMHAALLAERGDAEARARSAERDTLTLFDESGVVVAYADPVLADAIRGFRWRELFVERRSETRAMLRAFLFGHAQLEKALNPYVGFTARAILVPVGEVFLAASREAQVATLDHHLARWLSDRENLSTTHNLHPFPHLGMPGWFAPNESAAFYDNASYFRSGRRTAHPA